MKPYYDDGRGIVLYCGDWRDVMDELREADCAVTDPPYGIDYQSGAAGVLPRSILGDKDTVERDSFLSAFGDAPALVFGSWKVAKPARTHTLLIWDTKGALGMGDLSVPWKPSHQEIYVLGHGFTGRRDSDVLCYAPVQSMASNGRQHPHEKPVDLMMALLQKCPAEWLIADPFAGSGPIAEASRRLARKYIGVEKVERYCEIAAERLSQEVLAL